MSKKEKPEPGQKIDIAINYLKLIIAMLEEISADLKTVLQKE